MATLPEPSNRDLKSTVPRDETPSHTAFFSSPSVREPSLDLGHASQPTTREQLRGFGKRLPIRAPGSTKPIQHQPRHKDSEGKRQQWDDRSSHHGSPPQRRTAPSAPSRLARGNTGFKREMQYHPGAADVKHRGRRTTPKERKAKGTPPKPNQDAESWLKLTGFYDNGFRESLLHKAERVRNIDKERQEAVDELQHALDNLHASSSRPRQAQQRFAKGISRRDPDINGGCSSPGADLDPSTPPPPALSASLHQHHKKRSRDTEHTLDEAPSPGQKRARIVIDLTASPVQAVSHATAEDEPLSTAEHIAATDMDADSRLARTASEQSVESVTGDNLPESHAGEAQHCSTGQKKKHRKHQKTDKQSPSSGKSTKSSSAANSLEHDKNPSRRKELPAEQGVPDQTRQTPETKTKKIKRGTQYFVLRVPMGEFIAKSREEGVWAVPRKFKGFLEDACQKNRVILFFREKYSKTFSGYCRIRSRQGMNARKPWMDLLHKGDCFAFRVVWESIVSLPSCQTKELVDPFCGIKPISQGRDFQPLSEETGLELKRMMDQKGNTQATEMSGTHEVN